MTTIWISIVVLSILSLIFGAILGYASYYFQMEEDCIIEQINAVLPQNQCAQCGYMGCRLYAEAIVKKKKLLINVSQVENRRCLSLLHYLI